MFCPNHAKLRFFWLDISLLADIVVHGAAQPSVVPVDFTIQTAPSNHSSISSLPKATSTSSINVDLNHPSLRVWTVLRNRVLLERVNAQLVEIPTDSTSTQQLLTLSSSTEETLQTHMQMGSNSNKHRKHWKWAMVILRSRSMILF